MSQRNEVVEIILGIILTLVMHGLALSMLILASPYLPYFNQNYNFLLIPVSIGLWQFIYVIPLIFWLIRRQQRGVMKGVIICAVLTALISGGCWGIFILPNTISLKVCYNDTEILRIVK